MQGSRTEKAEVRRWGVREAVWLGLLVKMLTLEMSSGEHGGRDASEHTLAGEMGSNACVRVFGRGRSRHG